MSIILDIDEDVAVFRYPEKYFDADKKLHDLLDRNEAGQLGATELIAETRRLIDRYPDFMDGHAHLGIFLLEQDEPSRAMDAFMRGFTIGEKAIPSDYRGLIEWAYLNNRHFLRAARGVASCYRILGQRRKAVGIMEKILAWNPNDNQGVRHIIGSEYLRLGQTVKSATVFKAESPHYRPYRYDLALLLLRKESFELAATSLRHGFIENGYIAEMLCGNPNPIPLAIWDDFILSEAQYYVSDYGELWRRTEGALAFLRWLHTHPMILDERAAILKWEEALLWERDFEHRGLILREMEKTVSQRINDHLSRQIVAARADRDGHAIRPWLYSKTWLPTAYR